MSDRIFPIGPISSGGNASPENGSTETPANPPPEKQSASPGIILASDHRKKPLPLVWIPVLICLGLLIAAGYLGRRIFSARAHSAHTFQTTSPVTQARVVEEPIPQTPVGESPIQPAAKAEPVAAPTESAVEASPQSSSPETQAVQDLTLITPQPGERYIQISALNTEAARKYVAELRRGPLEPHAAPGPRPGIVRILIGPFHDGASLAATRADLLAAGIDCFIRDY